MGALRILSYDERPFTDRREAGLLLAAELLDYRNDCPLVLGIPRGGVIIGEPIAEATGGELDVVLTRKLGAPYNPELAIGAVTEDGQVLVNQSIAQAVGVSQSYIEMETERVRAEIRRRAELYRQVRPKAPLLGRVVILTDDGIATGATMKAALQAVSSEEPAKVIIALPVGPAEALEQLARTADEVICLRAPAMLGAIGQSYLNFQQVEDEELLEILARQMRRQHA